MNKRMWYRETVQEMGTIVFKVSQTSDSEQVSNSNALVLRRLVRRRSLLDDGRRGRSRSGSACTTTSSRGRSGRGRGYNDGCRDRRGPDRQTRESRDDLRDPADDLRGLHRDARDVFEFRLRKKDRRKEEKRGEEDEPASTSGRLARASRVALAMCGGCRNGERTIVEASSSTGAGRGGRVEVALDLARLSSNLEDDVGRKEES